MPHSGHYRPTKENFDKFIENLKSKDVNLDKVDLGEVRGIKFK
jgi:hypothetical protein